MIETFVYIFVFITGTVVGSFVNVCAYRIPRGISVIKPRSSCPSCGAALKARELIPVVSYIFLRGRCAACHARISILYPTTELACGALWAALFWKLGLTFQFAVYAPLCSIFLAVLLVDLKWMRIPNALVLCALVPACAAIANYSLIYTGPERFRSVYNSANAVEPLLGLIPGALFLLIYAVTAAFGGGRGAIGMGDIKLLIPIGLALGLRQCLFAAFIAVILGGLVGAALLITRVKSRKDPIPFGPFLVIGAIAAIFLPVSILFI